MSTSKREHLFPTTSIGRSASPALPVRTASHDSLGAHPLDDGAPRYTPYTPRARGPTTTTTTSTSAPVATRGGDARSTLQLVRLKAAAQAAALDAGALGWALLERLVGDAELGPEWAPIWDAIAQDKVRGVRVSGRVSLTEGSQATLLLPNEPAHSHEQITPELVKDHIVLCDGASRADAPIITLSGLRGQLTGQGRRPCIARTVLTLLTETL
jgi:hypothetical protein